MQLQSLLVFLPLLCNAMPASPNDPVHRHKKRDVVTVTEFIDQFGNPAPPPDQNNGYTNKPTSTIKSKQSTFSYTSTKPTSTIAKSQPKQSTKPKESPKPKEQTSSAPMSKFKDGTIKCSEFPSVNDIVPLPWLGFNGWSSISNMNNVQSNVCKDGYYCSYACKPGMLKTQWPATQPDNGVTVGGLLCKDGYLYRSNTNTDNLCENGVQSADAINHLGESIALCRTDYPGSENMVVPTLVEAGSSAPISVVDQSSYFQWLGKKTSAQYYVNNPGTRVEDACIWSTAGSNAGNWAPLILGAGYSHGMSYLSLTTNPNNTSGGKFNVKIVASPGSVVDGECVYENGSFKNGGVDGCTVAVRSGSAQYVFY